MMHLRQPQIILPAAAAQLFLRSSGNSYFTSRLQLIICVVNIVNNYLLNINYYPSIINYRDLITVAIVPRCGIRVWPIRVRRPSDRDFQNRNQHEKKSRDHIYHD
jgi:hypothetical protein